MAHTLAQDYWTAQADAVAAVAAVAAVSNRTLEEPQANVPQWDDFKYGLCAWCSKGLEDKSDFVVTEEGYGNTTLVCYDCYKDR
jgi:hypothetical protein